ncbi:MAG: hypothetical protein ACI85I_000077, partial [Arenicella sp.]
QTDLKFEFYFSVILAIQKFKNKPFCHYKIEK